MLSKNFVPGKLPCRLSKSHSMENSRVEQIAGGSEDAYGMFGGGGQTRTVDSADMSRDTSDESY